MGSNASWKPQSESQLIWHKNNEARGQTFANQTNVRSCCTETSVQLSHICATFLKFGVPFQIYFTPSISWSYSLCWYSPAITHCRVQAAQQHNIFYTNFVIIDLPWLSLFQFCCNHNDTYPCDPNTVCSTCCKSKFYFEQSGLPDMINSFVATQLLCKAYILTHELLEKYWIILLYHQMSINCNNITDLFKWNPFVDCSV
jgi:hypothetical protein